MPFLMVSSDQNRLITLAKTITTIGRHESQDIVLPHSAISRAHARIIADETGYVIEDLGSRNGTFVNGQRLSQQQPHLLANGDEIKIETYPLTFFFDKIDAPSADPGETIIKHAMDQADLHQTQKIAVNSLRQSAADQRLTLLIQLGETLDTISDIPSFLKKLLDLIFSTLRPERGFIGLYDDEISKFSYELAYGQHGQKSLTAFKKSQRIIDFVLNQSKSIIAGEGELSNSAKHTSATIREGIVSAMCCPIRDQGKIHGVIYIDDRALGSAFKTEDLQFLSFLGIFAAKILTSAREKDLLLRNNLAMQPQDFGVIFGNSPRMKEIEQKIPAIAATNFPVLILGETGTGKTFLAQEIHKHSPRGNGPFVKVNCSAIPENLIESELFGYVAKSGIANADPKGKPGKFELADGGTLFLDEIGDMPLPQQIKILDAIEDKLVSRIGAIQPRKVNVRIIAATSRNLDGADRKNLREDLYHRLSRVSFTLPPLRSRPDVIPVLAKLSLAKLSLEMPKRIAGISPAALDSLMKYDWPGNIRELENAICGAMIECPGGQEITPLHLSEKIRNALGSGGRVQDRDPIESATLPASGPSLLDPAVGKADSPAEARPSRPEEVNDDFIVIKDDAEFSRKEREKRDVLIAAIRATGSLTKAAASLGMSKQWAIQLAKKYGIRFQRREGPAGTR